MAGDNGCFLICEFELKTDCTPSSSVSSLAHPLAVFTFHVRRAEARARLVKWGPVRLATSA